MKQLCYEKSYRNESRSAQQMPIFIPRCPLLFWNRSYDNINESIKTYEYDWQAKEEARFSKIQNYLALRSEPKLWPIPSTFFSRSAWDQMQNERKLMASPERAIYSYRKSLNKVE